uniref:CUB domain-containing protein n=1 Tax=Meloidogyne incognita TaxID=6306 RepID=A0A914NXE1_MELIC
MAPGALSGAKILKTIELEPEPRILDARSRSQQAIRLRFDKIGFTTSFGSCFYNTRQNNPQIQDYVELSGGHSSNEVANKRYICPRYPFVAPGGEIVTSGIRPFSITYSTSGSPTNKGFLFYYETFNIGCGGVFTINENGEQKITITSPNYPEPYIPFMYCVYFLRVPIGKAVRLSFDVFDVENVAHRDDCDFDNVRVFDTYTDDNEHGQLLGK